MSVLSHSDTELGPLLGSPLSPIKSPKAAEPGSCQPGSVAELGLKGYIKLKEIGSELSELQWVGPSSGKTAFGKVTCNYST